MFSVKFKDGSSRELETLVGANLRDANLRDANLRDADLVDADLRGADLRGADLRGADLRGANLRGANLQSAYLVDADLRGADLRGANLQSAKLQSADLRGANLQRADLQRANLQSAKLQSADLRGAYLVDADLRGANLRDAKLPDFQICPEKGCFRAFKRVCYNGYYLTIELEIAASARRTSSLVGRKCRAERARVVTKFDGEARSAHDRTFMYRSGVEVVVADYDDDIRVECARGIHFFMTKAEADEYM